MFGHKNTNLILGFNGQQIELFIRQVQHSTGWLDFLDFLYSTSKTR